MIRAHLGTNFGHGASAALITNEGVLLRAVEEGRLIGKKECSTFPWNSISFVSTGYDYAELCWAEAWHATRRLLHKGLATTIKYGGRDRKYFNARLFKEIKRAYIGHFEMSKLARKMRKPEFVGHHESHAFSLLPWGLPPNSLILVSDYTGEYRSISAYLWTGRTLNVVFQSPFPHSLGAAFHELASHFGHTFSTGPGKVMGLSAFGDPKWKNELMRLFDVGERTLKLNLKVFPVWRRMEAWAYLAKKVSPAFSKEIEGSLGVENNGRDLAASIQSVFEEITWKILERSIGVIRNRYGIAVEAVGLAGGCALNCQANGRINRKLEDNFGLPSSVVSPWSDDSGTSIGAAVFSAVKNDPTIQFERAKPFLGPKPGGSVSASNGADSCEAVSALIRGEAIGLVSGRLEFGPRALGGRCILADPRFQHTKTKLNSIKGRPGYMPFAPVVFKEDFDGYFFGVGSSNMAWTVPFKDGTQDKFPGVSHRSGESRVLVVNRAEGLLGKLMEEFRAQTGSSMLILTSLNGSGEAIPDSLSRALEICARLRLAGLLSDSGWHSISKVET